MLLLVQCGLFLIGLNLIIFLPAYFFRTDRLTDISYSLSFVSMATYLFYQSPRTCSQKLVYGFILLWAIRLGGYLFFRISKMKKDERFNKIRNNFLYFFLFWLLQGFSVWIIVSPVILFFYQGRAESHSTWWILMISWAGLLIESIADYQKYLFKSNLENTGKFIQSGLYKRIRYPNYLGEIAIWTGIAAFCASNITGLWSLACMIGPVYLILLLTFISGIRIQEESKEARLGSRPEYQQYKRRSYKLLPFVY